MLLTSGDWDGAPSMSQNVCNSFGILLPKATRTSDTGGPRSYFDANETCGSAVAAGIALIRIRKWGASGPLDHGIRCLHAPPGGDASRMQFTTTQPDRLGPDCMFFACFCHGCMFGTRLHRIALFVFSRPSTLALLHLWQVGGSERNGTVFCVRTRLKL